MKYLRAFIAGFTFPALIIPFVYIYLLIHKYFVFTPLTLQSFPLLIPIVFGLWNVIYYLTKPICPFKKTNSKLWASGIVLGLILAPIGIFILEVPQELFGYIDNWKYFPFIFLPILYGIIWRFIIKYFNKVLSLQ